MMPPEPTRMVGYVPDEDGGRVAADVVGVVVLGQPVAGIVVPLSFLGQRQRVVQGFSYCFALGDNGQV
jgi:hypothetical protein